MLQQQFELQQFVGFELRQQFLTGPFSASWESAMFWVPLLLTAWAGVLASCALLLRAAAVASVAAPAPPDDGAGGHRPGELNLYETAYLAGGPRRVAELTLLSMQRGRRLLLARTGWATVVDPVGRDPHERSVLAALGPDGQAPVVAVRGAAAWDEAVRVLADRLDAAGLALPAAARGAVAGGVRAVRRAAALVAATALAALCLPADGTARAVVLCWFSMPLLLALGCLAIARFETYPYSAWASPAGQRLLVALDREQGGADPLTTVALRGVRVLTDPALRAAMAQGVSGLTALRCARRSSAHD
ncbi:TIGR04222 domain-containing membrane protein [Streptomyces sp. 2132.2]|uniref:TIGR04222 domain-containing membrane protein n=1 Tax=Streptomyces sp. 2132.2 TaxID=2485161 RepID=UPI00288B5013|nr:TIGR04222 domain-containing membrane protein [Streptomyces sp. 2132.2]